MNKNNYYILTGAFGSGKSTVIEILKERGFMCVNEPARVILAEQRAVNGNGVPETDPELFTRLMMDYSVDSYMQYKNETHPVIFDRGMPDLAAYAKIFGLDELYYRKISESYRYNSTVFCFNGWGDIYINDNERKADFNTANGFGVSVKQIYAESGYNVVDVPFTDVKQRSDFIVDIIKR